MTTHPQSHYGLLGVSATKEDVLSAAQVQGDGLFPGAFCKIVPDLLSQSKDHCLVLHSDGAGTKSIVAYLDFREKGDPSVFAGLAQDALVMNIDDLLCVGARGPFVVTNTIGRHRALIPAAAIEAIISGYQHCADTLADHGVSVALCGGETADLGDLVRTCVVDAAVACRMRRNAVIDGSGVKPTDLIVGLSGTGQATYEDEPNSSVGSNGLTLARHVLLKNAYMDKYAETCAPDLDAKVAYQGPFSVTDEPAGLGMTIGEALRSPTRTYAPVIAKALEQCGDAIHAIVHNTGGGQTKCLRLPGHHRFIKDNVFEPPPLFALIQKTGNVSWKEMYQVFNMGHRMELYVEPEAADTVAVVAARLGIDARIIGRVEHYDEGFRLRIEGPEGSLEY